MVGSINAALSESGDDGGCSKIKDIVSRRTWGFFLIILKRLDDTSVDRNATEP